MNRHSGHFGRFLLRQAPLGTGDSHSRGKMSHSLPMHVLMGLGDHAVIIRCLSLPWDLSSAGDRHASGVHFRLLVNQGGLIVKTNLPGGGGFGFPPGLASLALN